MDRSGYFAIPPDDQEMTIDLKNNWESICKPDQARMHAQGSKGRALIDEFHNKHQRQGRLYYRTKSTPFSFPIFVICKVMNGQRKFRVVVDIRAFQEAFYIIDICGDITIP